MEQEKINKIISFKSKTIEQLKYEFDQLKNDINLNKDFYENCLKFEFEKNIRLKNLIKDIASKLSIFILDSENQLIFLEKISKKNQLLVEENKLMIDKNKILINKNIKLKYKEKLNFFIFIGYTIILLLILFYNFFYNFGVFNNIF